MPTALRIPVKSKTVDLTYLTPLGREYAKGSYMTSWLMLSDIIEEVIVMIQAGKNPGLIDNAVIRYGLSVVIEPEGLEAWHVSNEAFLD
jgi:hypothetical protein